MESKEYLDESEAIIVAIKTGEITPYS